jgi:predicted AAA+ superfamily ATPase
VPDRLYPRYVRARIVEALGDTRVVMVMGARQVGKSTLTRSIAEREHPADILTLDDRTTRLAANEDPTAFVGGLRRPALIDEVQRAPDLLLAIKESVDRDPRPGRFLLTGSANILTAPKIAEALTGRMEIVQLWPLAQVELAEGQTNLVDALFAGDPPRIDDAPVGRDVFAERVARGGYPEARGRNGRRRSRWFESYLRTTFDRDLRDISDARRLDEMPRLLRLLATQAANLFSARNVAGRLALDHKTVASYAELLETVFLIRRVPAWRPGLGSREVQTPKVYVVDTGLLAYLLGADDERVAADDQIRGKALENFVAMELFKQTGWAETEARQYHYRDGRDEIDIVLESASGQLVAVEIKAAATVDPADYRSLSKLRDSRGSSFVAGAVLYAGPRTTPLSDRIWAIPLSALWS